MLEAVLPTHKKNLTCQKCTEVGRCIVLVDANNRRYVQVSIGLKTSTSTFSKYRPPDIQG